MRGPSPYPFFAFILGVFYCFFPLFLLLPQWLKALLGLYGVSYAGMILLSIVTVKKAGLDDQIIFQIMYPSIAVLATGYGLIFIRQVSDRILDQAKETLEDLRKAGDKNRSLMLESAAQLK